LAKYGSESPPEYDLSKISAPTTLISGAGDKASSQEDAEELASLLGGKTSFEVSIHFQNLWPKSPIIRSWPTAGLIATSSRPPTRRSACTSECCRACGNCCGRKRCSWLNLVRAWLRDRRSIKTSVCDCIRLSDYQMPSMLSLPLLCVHVEYSMSIVNLISLCLLREFSKHE